MILRGDRGLPGTFDPTARWISRKLPAIPRSRPFRHLPERAASGRARGGAAGGGIAALFWIRLLFLDAAPDLPEWLAEGLTTGMILGLAYGFHAWRGRRDRVAEGAKGFAAVLIFYMAVNLFTELIFN
jgi:hypothetical protein